MSLTIEEKFYNHFLYCNEIFLLDQIMFANGEKIGLRILESEFFFIVRSKKSDHAF